VDAVTRAAPLGRDRRVYATFALLVLCLGLATRPLRLVLPPVVAENIGDTLWAVLVYLLAALAWSQARTWMLAVGVALLSAGIEVSQLYHAPWIDRLRATTLGGLVLGYGFAWGDLLCYLVGVTLCALAEYHFARSRNI
jgi:hypothetical protein